MRFLKALCLLVPLCALAAAQQATVIQGTASNWVPGYYAGPFAPLIVTPSISLSTVSPSAVGASNATFGNVAGATNATLSNEFIAPPPTGVYTEPVFYNTSTPAAPEAEETEMVFEHHAGPHAGHAEAHEEMMMRHAHHAMELGIASEGPGIAAERAAAGPAKKATRTITNDDVDRMNQSTGTVKYDGKTEKL